MTEEGLINKIISTCGIYCCNPSITQTCAQSPLRTDAMKKANSVPRPVEIFISYHNPDVCYKQFLSKYSFYCSPVRKIHPQP